jgi:ankyrin repeat protein
MGNKQVLDIHTLAPDEVRFKNILPHTKVHGLPIATFACKNNNLALIQQLLTIPVPFDVVDKAGKTPLHYAASQDGSICNIVANTQNVNIVAADNSGQTPLHYAILSEKSEHTRTLKDCIFCKDNNGDTPLHLAVKQNNITAVKMILDNAEKPPIYTYKNILYNPTTIIMTTNCILMSTITNHDGNTALVEAIYNDAYIILEEFMKRGANVKHDCGNGSALTHAVKMGRIDKDKGIILLKILLKR